MNNWTISDLSEGRINIINNGTIEQLNTVLKRAFPLDMAAAIGNSKIYGRHYFNLEKWYYYE